jgi:hypothetical protein
MSIDNGRVRAHGQTVADEAAENEAKEIDVPVEHTPDKPLGLTRAFQRMRTDWHSEDKDTIKRVQSIVDEKLFDDFADAHAIRFEMFDLVRAKKINPTTGEIEVDEFGAAVWKQHADGTYVEDWNKLTSRDRERLIYQIITRMVDWEQKAADAWGEALFAKAYWQEAFSTGFDSFTETKAIEKAREARANRQAADSRYLAVYKSVYSKKAEALVRSMDRICQRLKDLTV